MAVEVYYTDIIERGAGKNKYYQQTYQDRNELASHITRVDGIVRYRQGVWSDIRDWKKFRSEMMDEVKWAKGQHSWKPSIDDMLWKLMETGTDDYNGIPARFSVRQIENFNKYCSIIAKVWNTYHKDNMMTANELQVVMKQRVGKSPGNNLNKFIED